MTVALQKELNHAGGLLLADDRYRIKAWNSKAQHLLSGLCSLRRESSLAEAIPPLRPYFEKNMVFYAPISLMIPQREQPVYATFTMHLSGYLFVTLHKELKKEFMTSSEHLIAGFAQEIRTPLTAVNTALGLASRCAPQCMTWREIEEEVTQQVWRVNQVIEFLAILSRRDDCSSDKTELSPVLLTIMQEFSTAHVMLYKNEYGGEVTGNTVSLYHAFREIIKNAAEASPEQTSISIAVAEYGDTIVTTITNLGEGILPEHTSIAFEPFFSTKKGHTGMGLTIARKLIHACHGSIYLYGNGEGTTVKVYLRKREQNDYWTTTKKNSYCR